MCSLVSFHMWNKIPSISVVSVFGNICRNFFDIFEPSTQTHLGNKPVKLIISPKENIMWHGGGSQIEQGEQKSAHKQN